MLKNIPILVIFLIILNISILNGQSKAEYFEYNGDWIENNKNYPNIYLKYALRRNFFGYFYVEGIIKVATINGYTYEGVYYSGNTLSDYGISFPMEAKIPLATIEFSAMIVNIPSSRVYDEKINLDKVANATREIVFNDYEKGEIKKYGKSHDMSSAELWEKHGYFSQVDLVSFSTTSSRNIESAIRSFLKDRKKQTAKNSTKKETYVTNGQPDENNTDKTKSNNSTKENKSKSKEKTKKKNKSTTNYTLAADYYLQAQTAYYSGNYNLALRYIESALNIDPNNYKYKSFAQKIREKSIAQNFGNSMQGLAEAGITSGIMYNSLSSFGLVFGYHSGTSSYRKNRTDNWSVLFSVGILDALEASISETGTGINTYTLMIGLPYDIENPLAGFPLPLIGANYLTLSIGASQDSRSDPETGWNIGLQDISDDIGAYFIYDTHFGLEFGIMAAFK